MHADSLETVGKDVVLTDSPRARREDTSVEALSGFIRYHIGGRVVVGW